MYLRGHKVIQGGKLGWECQPWSPSGEGLDLRSESVTFMRILKRKID